MTTKPNHSSPHFSNTNIFIVGLIVISICMAGISYNYGVTNGQNHPADGIYLTGHITVWLGTMTDKYQHLIVNKTDQLYTQAYGFTMCKLFNDTGDCTLTSTGCFGSCSASSSCPALTGTSGTPAEGLGVGYSKNYCTLTSIGLGTDNTIPGGATSNPTCTNYLTANSLGAVHATATANSAPTLPNTSPVTLSATFTSSGSQSGIQKVCLFMYNGYDKTTVLIGSPPTEWASDSLGTSVSLSTSQSLTIQWQFSL